MPTQNWVAKLAANTVLGGAASVAAGGKFENGAITGAFGYLFNELGTYAQRGYEPTYYDAGDYVCNGGAYPTSCGVVGITDPTSPYLEGALLLTGGGRVVYAAIRWFFGGTPTNMTVEDILAGARFEGYRADGTLQYSHLGNPQQLFGQLQSARGPWSVGPNRYIETPGGATVSFRPGGEPSISIQTPGVKSGIHIRFPGQ